VSRFIATLFTLSLLLFGCSADDEPLSFTSVTPPSGPGSSVPDLTVQGERLYLSWIEEPAEGDAALRFASFDGSGWSEPRVVHQDSRLLVNWADFPSLAVLSPDLLAAHWLTRQSGRGFAYDIAFASSGDAGQSWSEPLQPHGDATPTEHGFVSMVPAQPPGLDLLWLDGREMGSDGGTMTLRHASWDGERFDGEQVVDDDVCTCCQTDAVRMQGELFVAYRDHEAGEIRDIRVARQQAGRWRPGVKVHDDQWKIAGCPVNGPALAADDGTLAVAWFSAAEPGPSVQVAFSTDLGASFTSPVQLDGGNALGRVDVVLLEDGSAVVSWLEKNASAAEVRLRRVAADGTADEAWVIGSADSGRPSGFPRLARLGSTLFVTWTDPGHPSRLKMSRADL